MNPLEFVALTAKNNCGECGCPTCLAFAVAVTKGGQPPLGCPYVKASALPDELVQEAGREGGLATVEKGQNERDMALVSHLKAKVRDLDFSRLAPLLGAELLVEDGFDNLVFPYLDRQAVMSSERLTLAGESLVDPRDQILLYNYVAFGGGTAPSENWIGMESLPNSISKIRTLATYCEHKLADKFSGRASRLGELCLQVGGRHGAGEQNGDVGMVIPVLPFVPLYLIFWDEDTEDGFPAKVKILFDENVMNFLDLESLVFAAEKMAERILEFD